jgi:Icc-related predicted phosphoesterase
MASSIKILAISDRVEPDIHCEAIGEHFGDVDLVLACGDLPYHYIEFISAKLAAPLLYVLGNHDHGVFTANGGFKQDPLVGVNLDGRVEQVKGLLIAGLEGSMRYSDRGRHQYTEMEMWGKALRMSPALWANRLRYGRFLDILITHAPPYKIHDGDDLCHTGFRTFRWMMEFYRPRYLIHGHQHVYSPHTIVQTQYHHTQVINAYGCQVIHWTEEWQDIGESLDV